eukprot:scaffold9956_cov113-Skeletonema_dohrnii-CCMP3373.AAC.2
MMNGHVDGGGSESGNASEPSGEGVEADYVDYYIADGIDNGGGGQYVDYYSFVEIRILTLILAVKFGF